LSWLRLGDQHYAWRTHGSKDKRRRGCNPTGADTKVDMRDANTTRRRADPPVDQSVAQDDGADHLRPTAGTQVGLRPIARGALAPAVGAVEAAGMGEKEEGY
jgi:hypothetical protein